MWRECWVGLMLVPRTQASVLTAKGLEPGTNVRAQNYTEGLEKWISS